MIRSDGMAALAAAVLALGAGSVQATTIGGPLNLADEGMFFVNGKTVVSKYPGVSPAGPVKPGAVMVNQMYVHYRIPVQRASAMPIVLVHGGGLTGASFETTPDGREGWATYLVRKGHSVYVVDTPGRGRAGFNATAINQAKIESDVSVLPASVLMVTAELAWTLFRFGPSLRDAVRRHPVPRRGVRELRIPGRPVCRSDARWGCDGHRAPRARGTVGQDRAGCRGGPLACRAVRRLPRRASAQPRQGGDQHRRRSSRSSHRCPDRRLSRYTGSGTVRRLPGCAGLYGSPSLRGSQKRSSIESTSARAARRPSSGFPRSASKATRTCSCRTRTTCAWRTSCSIGSQRTSSDRLGRAVDRAPSSSTGDWLMSTDNATIARLAERLRRAAETGSRFRRCATSSQRAAWRRIRRAAGEHGALPRRPGAGSSAARSASPRRACKSSSAWTRPTSACSSPTWRSATARKSRSAASCSRRSRPRSRSCSRSDLDRSPG